MESVLITLGKSIIIGLILFAGIAVAYLVIKETMTMQKLTKNKRIVLAVVIAIFIGAMITGCIKNTVFVDSGSNRGKPTNTFKATFEQLSKDYIADYANERYAYSEKSNGFKSENVEIVRIERYGNTWESIGEIKAIDSLFKVNYNEVDKTLSVTIYTKEAIDDVVKLTVEEDAK